MFAAMLTLHGPQTEVQQTFYYRMMNQYLSKPMVHFCIHVAMIQFNVKEVRLRSPLLWRELSRMVLNPQNS